MQKQRDYSLAGWFIVVLGALFYCYEYFLRIMPSVMTTELMHTFRIDATLLGNLAAFYYYAYTPMQIPVGVMMDKYGPKRLLVFAIQICALGVLLFGGTHNLTVAYLGRFLVGFGSAFAFVGVLKLATLWLPLRFFAFVAGGATALGMLGGMFGSIYLEKLVRVSGWESTIKISVMAALVLAILVGFFMPFHQPKNAFSDESAALSYRELLKNVWFLFKNPLVWLNGFVGCMLYLSLSVFAELWGPKFLQIAHHLSSQQAVLATSKVFLAWAIGGPIIGMLAKDIRRSLNLMLLGSLVAFIFSTILLSMRDLSLGVTEVILFCFAFGSATQVLIFNVVCSVVDRKFAGTAIAFTNALVMAGGLVFEPLVGKILDLLWHGQFIADVRSYSVGAFNTALLVIPIGAALSFLALLIMRRMILTHLTQDVNEVLQEDMPEL